MRVIHTELQINASPENIWKTLVVSPGIPVEIREAIHERKTGQKLKVLMDSHGKSMTLNVTVLSIDPFREIRWKGYLVTGTVRWRT